MLGLFDTFSLCCTRARATVPDSDQSSSDRMLETDTAVDPTRKLSVVVKESILNVEREGFLDKRGDDGVCRSHFAMLKHDLFLFQQQEDVVPVQVVMLSPFTMEPQVCACEHEDEKHCIKITYPTNLIFRAECKEDIDQWRDVLSKAIESHKQGLTEVEAERVLFEGFLECFGVTGDWAKLWFVLRPGMVEYFESMGASHPIGKISLQKTDLAPTVRTSVWMEEPHILQLVFSTQLHLSADSPTVQEEWIAAIANAIREQSEDRGWMKKNPVGWKRAGRVREVISPLVDLLRDPFRLQFFRLFCKLLCCERFVLFWLDVQQFRRLCKKEDKQYLKLCAIVIFQKYIKEGSALDVGIPEEIREQTTAFLDDPNMNTFKECQACILQTMYDFYPAFLISKFCKDMAEQLFSG